MSKPIILTFVGHYLPGYKFGGPLRTIANIVHHLGQEFDFRIVTRDRDLRDDKAYEGILVDQWQVVGKAQVYYVSPARTTLNNISGLIKNTPHDLLYLNSFFDPMLTFKPLLARFLRKIPPRPVILAPRGEFSASALKLKKLKKRIYLAFIKTFNLHKNMVWHASNAQECRDIKIQPFLQASSIQIALDLFTPWQQSELELSYDWMNISALRVIFLSRITPMKHLDYALKRLMDVDVKVNIVFDIYGPLEDVDYWQKCQILIRNLPPHVKVNYCGSVRHEDVITIFSRYDLFFLPTLGENYGHVIAEALAAGTPVLISNKTGWTGLHEEELGWDLALEKKGEFVRCIEYCASLPINERRQWRQKIQIKSLRRLINRDDIEANRQLFLSQLN